MSNTELLSSEAANGASPAGQQDSEANGTPRRRGGLSGMVLAELRQLAGELGIETGGLRKGDLIAAIKEKQGGTTAPRTRSAKKAPARAEEAPAAKAHQPALDEAESAPAAREASTEQSTNGAAPARTRSRRQQAAEASGEGEDNRRGGNRRRRSSSRSGAESGGAEEQQRGERKQDNRPERESRQERDGNRQERGNRQDRDNRPQDDEDDEGGRRGRGRRFRDRRRNRGRGEGGEPEVREDDVLLPVAGILDVLENYAFVRTSGYLAGPNDVYVSLSLVRKYNLRRGDAIKGVIRQPREGEQQRQKFNPLVRVDSINGLEPDAAKNRPEFHKLTPLYPNERLRLETEPQNLTGRIIDLVMPVGKGQRALIVSPPKAGKTMVLQAIANAITTNNPECHLMVVLADERPEEVTDMQRSVKGEVIASTFDRPPSDHTTVAELSIERAKRLVEMGHDVVVLLDSITRLGRAYNLAAPASGRILSGGVDSTALYPPKRFLGAARNIENGGSLTIFATALVETGSTMDTVIFEEFKGTGNAELKLDRKLADKRLFPAVDVDSSSTRKDEILLSPDELAVTHKLRRVLAALDSQQALELLQDRLRKSRTNIEFLMQVAKTTPGKDDD
ncbi:transcription termination factor Rho [Saccharopolyspora kobensis]|uniref:Transcription termination factor Rho n=1 Tax=Saccharopolyspora kobensis TaxID=146035 RepID=A0A1H6EMS3_9PSEU|nr:transcription termination factor Rho [Saccharopolyspora kobensis]SEG98296.1 transcription termination factor Rho [Saccharopolyspora kobensis]SFE70679.1 transcription termination factor Rho [Saccharopolyspora kobensis]